MVVFDKPYITIEVFEEEGLVYTEWHGFANSEEYRAVLNHYTEIANTYNISKWIGNAKNAKAIRPIDQEWTLREWIVDFAKTKVRRMAVIVSDDVFNRMAVDNLLTKSSGIVKFDTKYFKSVDEAKRWVSEIDQSALNK